MVRMKSHQWLWMRTSTKIKSKKLLKKETTSQGIKIYHWKSYRDYSLHLHTPKPHRCPDEQDPGWHKKIMEIYFICIHRTTLHGSQSTTTQQTHTKQMIRPAKQLMKTWCYAFIYIYCISYLFYYIWLCLSQFYISGKICVKGLKNRG
jgi:hypothetical protein